MSNKAHTHMRGVTLIEMLVAFAIVSVTFVAVVEAFLSSSRATQMAQRQAEVADAISYVLADIAREAQVSGEYEIVDSTIKMKRKTGFAGIDPVAVVISHENNQLKKQVGSGDVVSLTPPNVFIDTFRAIPGTNPDRIIVQVLARHEQSAPNEQMVLLQTTFTERSQ